MAEIPDSHPCYLVPDAYLLPSGVPLTRRLVGTGAGTYWYNTVNPNGSTLVLENVATAAGEWPVPTMMRALVIAQAGPLVLDLMSTGYLERTLHLFNLKLESVFKWKEALLGNLSTLQSPILL